MSAALNRRPHLLAHPGRWLTPLIAAVGLVSAVAVAKGPRLKAPLYTGYGISTESPTATRDAAAVLRDGGSAADAAVVAALVAGVASPTSSGIGGGGFAVGWDPKRGAYALDFREVGAAALKRKPFESRPLKREQSGHLIGVPGEIAGLYELHRQSGTKSWSSLVKIAAKRAHEGFTVSRHLGGMLVYAQGKLQKLPGFSPLFYSNGKAALIGSRLTHPSLGRTLDKLATQGPQAFYEGDIAADIVETARAHGSPLTLDDLKNYKTRDRKPLRVEYEGREVFTMPPPSAGGLMMVQALKMFSADYLRGLKHGSPAYQHVLAEALRGAVADRMRYVGDPDHQKVDLSHLLDETRLDERRARISLDRTHSIPRFGLEEKGTHALVIADRKGHVISLTTTVNHMFGSKIYAKSSGIFLNNELDDFTARENVAPFGMDETPNRARPSARPVSSMTPTVVLKDGSPVLALGGSGGTAIATNATQTLLAALVFDHEPKTAVSADRFYIPTNGKHILVEKKTAKSHVSDLERRGNIVGEMPFTTTGIQMLRMNDGKVRGAADPRKHGEAIAR